MKKTFKRAGVAVLSMAMLLSMGTIGAISANAEVTPPASGGITVNLPTTPASAEYEIYQVAAATYNATEDVNKYTSIGTSFASDLQIVNYRLQTAAGAELDGMDAASVRSLADTLLSHATTGSKVTGTYDAATHTTASLDPGYYLIKTTNVSGAVSPILIEVKNATVSPSSKASTVTIDKGIQGTSDTSNGTAYNNLGLAGVTNAAGKVGDKVVYKIVTDIPNYDAGVTAANLNADYVITDTPSGVTIINGTNVTVAGTTVSSTPTVGIDNSATPDGAADVTLVKDQAGTEGYTLAINDTTGVMTITLNKEAVVKYKGHKVVVDYTAVINEDAVVSTASADNPNTNTAKLNYDNKHEGGGAALPADDQPSDETNVYTVQVSLTKTFTGDDHIAGAVLTLSKQNGANWDTIGTLTTTTTKYTETWTGLSAGTYQIEETNTPAGYVTATTKQFTIAATPDNGPNASALVFTFTGDTTDGTVTIHNPLKDSLPGTGGIGTTLFTVGGAAVILFAGFMFVVYMRKRRSEEE